MSHVLLFATDYCGSSPCLNGGTCEGLENGFECSCLLGFGGDRCEIGEWKILSVI